MPKKRPNNDGSIRQRQDGTWEARYRPEKGGRQKSLYADTQEEVKRKLRETLSQLDHGEYVEPSRLTVGAWLDTWLREYAQPAERPSTAATHANAIRLHLRPALGRILLQKLRTDQVQAFINQQQRLGFAPSTIKRQLSPLKSALKQAVENQLIQRNPAAFAKLPKQEQDEIEFLTADEQQALLAALPMTTQGRALRFILGTGLRVAELCGLRWGDITANTLHVQRVVYCAKGVLIENPPKTKAGKRDIPLNAPLKRILDEQRMAQMQARIRAGEAWLGGAPGKGETYVFATDTGSPANRNNLNRCLRGALDRAALKRRGVHALRHTFATNWVHAGKDLRSLSEILGHTNVAFTMQKYVHSDLTTKQSAMEAMGSLL